jgi:hypothetical protein
VSIVDERAIKFEKYNIQAGYQFQILERVKLYHASKRLYGENWEQLPLI